MNQREVILAGLAPAKGAPHSPVQVQKLFFLIDRNVPEEVGGPIFHFEPYNYGPFDRTVYDALEELQAEGYVDVIRQNTYRSYKLNAHGQAEGEKLLAELPEYVQKFITDASDFVRKMSFTQLVTAIYKAYPEMRANSVFQG